jgi:4-hydroxybenzoyl-CoA reductase subunit beta
MLRLQPFELLFPKDLADAVSLASQFGPDAKLCAGGTDLVPNMKHELHEPKAVIHLARLHELRGISESAEHVSIGAMTTLSDVSSSPLVTRYFPSLVSAANHIAGPQLRNMGTIGGNLCLDTRCLFYNQTYFWREAIGFCLKKCGDTCHVTQTGKRCVAAASNDTATALLCLDAVVEITSAAGTRTVPLDQFYVANGEKNTVLNAGDILTRIIIAKPKLTRREGFAKLRNREAIDFPILSIAMRYDLDDSGVICAAKLTVNALAAKPKLLNVDLMLGRTLSPELAAEVGEFAKARCIPLINICDDPDWRRDMVAVYVKRLLSHGA